MPGYSRVPAAAVLAVAVVALSACSHGSAPAPAQPAATARSKLVSAWARIETIRSAGYRIVAP